MARVALVLTLALALLLPVTAALADVLPDGKKNAQVQNYLEGTEAFADHTFMLVTLNNMDRERVQVRPDQLSGYLNVPSGYQDEPMLVALTADQLLEFATLAAALPEFADSTEVAGKSDDEMRKWVAGLMISEEEAKPLRDFFERDDVAKAPSFAFRTFVDQGDAAKTIRRHYKMASVTGGTITLTLTKEERLDDKGEAVAPPQGFWARVWGGIAAFFAGILSWLGIRRRRTGSTVPDDAI